MKASDMSNRIILVTVLFLLISSITWVGAQEEEDDDETDEEQDEYDEEDEPEYERDESGTVWIQTNLMTVMLSPGLPSYQYWYSADENGSLARFRVSYPMMVEFVDNNGDGVYQLNETVSYIPLEAFEWTLQTGAISNEQGLNEEVYASYTKGGLTGEDWEDDWYEEWMPGAGENETEDDDAFAMSDEEEDSDDEDDLNLTRYEDTTVQFYAHIYLDGYNGTVSDDSGIQANYSVNAGTELKIDIEIGNFPFTSADSKLTILSFLQEDIASSENTDHKFRLHEDDGELELDSEDEWEYDDDTGEFFEDLDEDGDGVDNDVQSISLIEASTNETRAFYTWLDKAVINLPNGTTEAVDVGASYFATGKALLLFFAYPYFDDGSLIHDPSLKLIEDSSPVTDPIDVLPKIGQQVLIGVSIVGIIAILAVAAVTIRKR